MGACCAASRVPSDCTSRGSVTGRGHGAHVASSAGGGDDAWKEKAGEVMPGLEERMVAAPSGVMDTLACLKDLVTHD